MTRSSKLAIVVDPNPKQMPYGALLCAAAACERSQHQSDRQFASDCKRELQRRDAEDEATRRQAQRRAA